eukprot:12424756-Karenia_brevis.AAC.1
MSDQLQEMAEIGDALDAALAELFCTSPCPSPDFARIAHKFRGDCHHRSGESARDDGRYILTGPDHDCHLSHIDLYCVRVHHIPFSRNKP